MVHVYRHTQAWWWRFIVHCYIFNQCNFFTTAVYFTHLATAERGQPRRVPLRSRALVAALEVERPLPGMALEEKIDRVFVTKLPLEQLLARERHIAIVHPDQACMQQSMHRCKSEY